ncbi:MAG: hypothetical protein VYA80_04035 [Pseudomonadota bacterium]|nr:hypothetical protein [Pseudomonadota bacterium]
MTNYNDVVSQLFFLPIKDFTGEYRGQACRDDLGTKIALSASLNSRNKFCQLSCRAFACPHIIAACNWLIESLEDQPVKALDDIDWNYLQEMLDIPTEKAGKLLILKDAIIDLRSDIRYRANLR